MKPSTPKAKEPIKTLYPVCLLSQSYWESISPISSCEAVTLVHVSLSRAQACNMLAWRPPACLCVRASYTTGYEQWIIISVLLLLHLLLSLKRKISFCGSMCVTRLGTHMRRCVRVIKCYSLDFSCVQQLLMIRGIAVLVTTMPALSGGFHPK